LERFSVHPSFSVIIPTFNRLEPLRVAVASVLNQTRPADEVIVVDDGSTDGTAEDIGSRFPDIHLIVQENRGVSAARNAGIRAAKGDWIALLDSDDAWLPKKLERQLAAVENAPEFRLCHTGEIWIRNGVRVNPMKKHAKHGGFIFEHCLPLCCISPSSVLIRRDVFDELGDFDEGLPACEDYDYWLRFCARYPVLYVDEPLLRKVGGHDDQLSRQYWGMDRFRIKALEKILDADVLTPPQSEAALAMMTKMVGVLAQGARKRGRQQEAKDYEQKLERTRASR
jgi:glycosyltransferase involved in cell wall biosynthesis